MAMSYCKQFYTYNFKKMGLRYEVGLNIITGFIFWWHGPLPPGLMNDNMICEGDHEKFLDRGEQVEADLGYTPSAPTYVNCPVYEIPSRVEMIARGCLRHETYNRRFNNWNILKAPYRHDILNHQILFGSWLASINSPLKIENLWFQWSMRIK